MSLDLAVRTNAIPEGFCFGGFASSSWLDILGLMYVRFPDDLALFNFGSDTPAPDRRDRPWIRTNADGTPDRDYVYAMGAWLSLHPDAPGKVIMYEGTEASIETFDGGEAGPVTSISGPMWEKVSAMDGKFPLGPGTLPVAGAIAVGDTGGEEVHTLVKAEMPKHDHGIPNGTAVCARTAPLAGVMNIGGTEGFPTWNEEGGDQPHNNMPPYHAIFFIRKTARTMYRI